jgi:epoxyqueuosine reductase
MDVAALTEELCSEARRLGFDLVAAVPAVEPDGFSRLQVWLDAGHDGQMQYLQHRREAYSHPRHVMPGVRSLLMLGMEYQTVQPATHGQGQGRVARYAWGADYHDLIHDRLKQLRASLLRRVPEATARGVVDTAPLLEREFAQLAGLGWIGKNTMLLNTRHGSYFFLAALLTDQLLSYSQVTTVDHCGTCRACLDACPTDAFPEPGVLDSRRCISYLTIELREPVPRELRPLIEDWVFGCDVCQEVCPWNRHAQPQDEPALAPRKGMNPLELAELFWLDEAGFRRRFRETPLWRPKRRGLLRNAALVLGNQRDVRAMEALTRGLWDEEPLVRGACAWALGQFTEPGVAEHLRRRLSDETDPQVVEEIVASLGASVPPEEN